jgi:hypothetical protein
VAEGNGLLNRHRAKSSVAGSNPALSATPSLLGGSLANLWAIRETSGESGSNPPRLRVPLASFCHWGQRINTSSDLGIRSLLGGSKPSLLDRPPRNQGGRRNTSRET